MTLFDGQTCLPVTSDGQKRPARPARHIDGARGTMSRAVDTEAEAEVAIAQMATEMGRDPHAE